MAYAEKRLTKQQRDSIEKKKLRARVSDIAIGAAGYNFDDDGEFATADFLERFVCALQVVFGTDNNAFLWKPHCLKYWDNIDSSTDALFQNGVRA